MTEQKKRTWKRSQHKTAGTVYTSGGFLVKKESHITPGLSKGGRTAWTWNLYHNGEPCDGGRGVRTARAAMEAADNGPNRDKE